MGMTFDGPSKVVTLTAGTVAVSVRDLWSRWVDWFLTSDNSKYLPAFSQVGGNDIDQSAGTKIPIYAFLVNGWKIKPQEANHTLTISDGILLVDGGGDPFNNTSGSYIVRINYQQPVQAISFSAEGGAGGLTATQDAKLMGLPDETLTTEEHAALLAGIAGEVIEGDMTVSDVLRLIVAVLAGNATGGGTTEIRFRDIANSKDRAVMTVDEKGNRSNVVLDLEE